VAMALLLQEAARTSPDLVTQIGMWGASIGINGENIVRADSLSGVSHAMAGYCFQALRPVYGLLKCRACILR